MIVSIKLFVLIYMLLIFPQTDNSRTLLYKVQEKYNTINDFSSDFIQSTGDGNINRGKFFYKADNKFRIEIKSRIIVCDGESTWTFTPQNNQVVISSSDDDLNSFSIRDYLYEYPKQCTVSTYENEDGSNTIILKPQTTDLEFKEIRLVINTNNLIQQIELYDLMNNNYKVALENTKLNQKIDDKLFTFEIPEGTRVIDLR